MARARNIKPGFFTNEELVELPFSTRLLFIGLWTEADRAGRMEDKPKRIKMKLFPADDLDVDTALQQLHDKGFLLRYEANGERYIQILAFDKHQNPHKDERKSEIPAPNLHRATTVQELEESGTCPASSLIPDSLNLTPDSNTTHAQARKRSEPIEDEKFVEAYSLYPSRPGSSKATALKAWKARLASGVDPDVIIAGVVRYAAYVRAAGTEPNFIKMPATFFGPDQHYLADWTPPQARASPRQAQQANTQRLLNRIQGTTNHEPDHRIIDLNERPA